MEDIQGLCRHISLNNNLLQMTEFDKLPQGDGKFSFLFFFFFRIYGILFISLSYIHCLGYFYDFWFGNNFVCVSFRILFFRDDDKV